MTQEQYFTRYIFELEEAIKKNDYQKFKEADAKNGGKMHNIALGNKALEEEIKNVYKKARERFFT